MATLAIIGPTASGKSALALEVARRRSGAGRATELVAVDAFTAYRRMDVGTAKPAPEDRAEVVHHLLDLREPWQQLSVAEFQALARGAIADVRARGATPLLVGGSGLYFRAVVDPLTFPPTEASVRARVEQRWRGEPAAGHAHLAAVDPDAAARIDPGNLRRIVRALEVIELTGQPFSAYDDGWERYDSVYPDLEVAYLEPPPEQLKAAIRARAERMVVGGLVAEARDLRALDQPLSRTAAQAIGYAEAFAVLDGELDEADLVAAIVSRTWRFAKQQRSWFRADPRCIPTQPAEVLARWA